MKLYLLRPRLGLLHPNPFGGYDSYDGFVVRALSETDARQLVTDETSGDERWNYPDAWTSSTWSTCEELTASGEQEIIMADFNAG